MSRTTRRKATHYNEYWGRRSWAGGGKHSAIHGPLTKRVTHRKERRDGKLACILGSLMLLLALSGCAQPLTAADDITARGIDAVSSLDKPQESAAPAIGSNVQQDSTLPASDPLNPITPAIVPKYMPPDNDQPRQVRRVLLFTDTSWCAPCRREAPELKALEASGMKVGDGFSTGMDVKVIEGQKHADWHRQFKITSLPTFVLLVDGKEEARSCGFLTAAQIKEFYLYASAPEVATQRPFAEPWRAHLPLRVRNLVHTDCEVGALALPTTVLHLKEQSIQFADSRESRLNRWFSVSFGAGTVSHNGSTVEFSNPPELRFHLFANREGEMLDSLKAIEFTAEGAAFHMTRFGTIHFRVK